MSPVESMLRLTISFWFMAQPDPLQWSAAVVQDFKTYFDCTPDQVAELGIEAVIQRGVARNKP